MPYCPNADCPFRKRLGESAEYNKGIATCSDCGTALVADDLLGKVVKKKEFRVRDLYKRLLWTLALLGFWNILHYFPMPGIAPEVMMLSQALWDLPGLRISLFSLGLMPYIAACVLVEVIALFVHPLKQWRLTGGELGRARLMRIARYLTLVIGTIYGGSLVWSIGNMAGGQALVDNGVAFKSLLTLSLVAAMFLTIWIADQISAHGLGHGISLIFLAGIVGGIPHNFVEALRLYKGAVTSPPFVMPLLSLAAFIVVAIYMERSATQVPLRYVDGTEIAFPLKLTTAGTTPVWWASSVLTLPLVFVSMNVSFTDASNPVYFWITTHLYPGTGLYTAANAGLVIIFYFILTALFHNPRTMREYLGERGASLISDGSATDQKIDRSLEGMALIGGLYLALLPLALHLIWWLLQTNVAPVNGISLIVAVCIALDLSSELRFRWRSDKLVPIGEFHEPWKAGLFRSLLEKEDVPCVIRGYYHRSLLYLFGPYIEMTVYAAADKADGAREVARKYMSPRNPLGAGEEAFRVCSDPRPSRERAG